jgi:UDP-glucuronate 4-epimerase
VKILVTGAAGFIGMHVAQALLVRGDEVVGVDNLNDYYDVSLKRARLAQLQTQPNFRFQLLDIADSVKTATCFAANGFDYVVHLAAQAGVRYSLTHPHAYAQSNLVGFLNILEGCRQNTVKHLAYASSSSVYGGNQKMPFAEDDAVDHPVSLYAATKKANELMAHSYSHLYNLPTSGLRFFTVYGPWGRPDMAYFSFTRAILAGEPIQVFNYGNMSRDFTYIDDIVDGVVQVLDQTPHAAANNATLDLSPATSSAPYRIINIGSHAPVRLLDFIAALESALGRSAQLDLQPMQAGDVPATYAEVTRLQALAGAARAPIALAAGVRLFVNWYLEYEDDRSRAPKRTPQTSDALRAYSGTKALPSQQRGP